MLRVFVRQPGALYRVLEPLAPLKDALAALGDFAAQASLPGSYPVVIV